MVKPFRNTSGHGAVLALVAYTNGSDALKKRAADAYCIIKKTVCHRQHKNFTLDDFFAWLRDTYATLEHKDINQTVPDLRQWSETLDKIADPQLH